MSAPATERYVAATLPSTIPAMHDAITRKMAAEPAFAKLVEAATTRVVDLKLRRGLATCS